MKARRRGERSGLFLNSSFEGLSSRSPGAEDEEERFPAQNGMGAPSENVIYPNQCLKYRFWLKCDNSAEEPWEGWSLLV